MQQMQQMQQPIYKVNYMNKSDNIESIYVFSGVLQSSIPNISDLFKTDPNNAIFSTIFQKEELETIRKEPHKIQVFFIDEQIHLDDTIDEIKKKIILAFSQTQSKTFALEEIYLFA